ncbi:MAG: hypothetical protein KI790_21375, partial [Cyclobacteriaceae bacterium]|nr:hypothetical protein [Cyclobacteriaceae bacterium HetDA_MAG_MS6]
DYDVETARHVVGQGTFTDLEIDFVEENLKLDFSYGDVFLTRIEKEFESIYITGKSTDINLILDQASYIKTEIKGPDQKMILPNSMLLMQKETLADKRISLSGFVGNTNRDFSQLDIDAQGGELIISIKEMPIFTDRD